MTTKSLKIQQIAAGSEHSLLLLNDGSVWATGDNYNSQLGDGTTDNKDHWTLTKEANLKATQVAAGSTHSLLLKADGSVWATGNNYYGQLGDGTTVNKNSWTQVMASEATQVAAGCNHSLLLKADGSVWATGNNYYGQLGDGTNQDKHNWTQITQAGTDVMQVAAGFSHSLLLKADGAVWAAGSNEYGQLGDGTNKDKNNWTPITQVGTDIIQVAAGFFHSLLLKTDGSVWATGGNAFGQLGDGTKKSKKKWTQITEAGTDIIQVAAGFSHSLLLKTDGSVWATGEIGSESNPSQWTTAQWTTVVHSGVTQLASGELHCLLVDEQGFLCVTGQNTQGQLGLPAEIEMVDTWFVHPFWQAFMLEQQVAEWIKNGERVLESDDEPVFCL